MANGTDVFTQSDLQKSEEPVARNTKEKKKAVRKVAQIAQESTEVIHEVKSIFPFDIVPDKVVISLNKVHITVNDILASRHFPLMVADIRAVVVDVVVVFASLRVEIMGYEANPPPIKFLPINEALDAKRIIYGLKHVYENNIDLAGLKADDVKDKLITIGKENAY